MLAPIHESVRLALPSGGELVGDLSFAQTPGEFAVVWVHGFEFFTFRISIREVVEKPRRGGGAASSGMPGNVI